MKFEIRVYDFDEQGNEVDVSKKTLDNRSDAADYVMKFQAEPQEYPTKPKMTKILDFADLMTVDEWIEDIKKGHGFMYDEGIGYYATETEESDIDIIFSEDKEDYDPRFTHVSWYNK